MAISRAQTAKQGTNVCSSDLGEKRERIEERLDDQRKTLEKLDLRLWGLAALIVALAAAERFI